MDKKILKYKNKKNKLESEILNLLKIKKINYQNDIIDSNNSLLITNQIENYFNELNKIKTNKLLIIVNGIYSVGKSTFINQLEIYIKKLSEINQINISIKKISNVITNIDNNKDNIIIIEINDNNLTNTISNNDQDIINIIILPKNKNALKNKYINKIILDIKNNKTDFIYGLNLVQSEIIKKIENNINLLKLKKNIYLDDDFIFLDDIVDMIFNLKLNSYQENQSYNTFKFYF